MDVLAKKDLYALVREVNKITTAPFLVALQPLQEAVQKVEGKEVQIWAAIKPCQIHKLATYLVEVVDWDDGLNPLAQFASVDEFGIALFQHKPALLSQLLEFSLDERIFASVTPLCLEIIKTSIHPYCTPDIPQYLPQFLRKLVEQFTQCPKSSSFRQVRIVIAGFSPTILECVPEGMLEKLINKCKTTMQTSNNHEDLLHCVDIARMVHQTYNLQTMPWRPGSVEETSSQSLMSQWAIKVSNWFTGAKVGSNILMTMCRLIFYLSMKEDIALAKRIEMIDVGGGILYVIERETIQEWCSNHPEYLEKLWRSAACDEVPPEVKLVAFGKCIRANPDAQNLEHVGSIVSSVLHAFTQVGDAIPLYTLSKALRYTTYITSSFNFLLDPKMEFCHQNMKQIMQFLIQHSDNDRITSVNELGHIQNALILVQALRNTFQKYPPVGQLAVRALQQVKVPNRWDFDKFDQTKVPLLNCGSTEVCIANFERLRIKLGLEFSLLMVGAASTGGETVGHHEFEQFRNRIMTSGSILSAEDCHYPEIEVFSKPESRNEESAMSMDWKQKFEKDFGAASKTVHDVATRYLQGVSYDLERRCETVEEPLAVAMNLLETANLDLNLMTERCAAMELSNEHSDHVINNLKVEVESVKSQRDAALTKATELKIQLKSAVTKRRNVQDERDSALQQLNEATEAIKATNAVRDAAMLALQEKFREEQHKATKLNVDIKWLTEQIETQRHEMNAAHSLELAHILSRHEDLQSETFRIQAELDSRTEEAERATMHNKEAARQLQMREDAIRALIYSKEELNTVKERLQSELQEKSEEVERLGKTIKRNHEEGETKDDIIENLTGASLQWAAEKERLQSEVNAGRRREKQVLAAIQGRLTSSQVCTASLSGTSMSQREELD